jgi:hypothetical protein
VIVMAAPTDRDGEARSSPPPRSHHTRTVALCGARRSDTMAYLTAFLRRFPELATVIVADDDPDSIETRLARIEHADEVLMLNDAGALRWPAAGLVAYAEAAGKPLRWLHRPSRRCPVCRSHAVALVADELVWCEAFTCGWIGDDSHAATPPDHSELRAFALAELTRIRWGRVRWRAA